MSRWEPKGWLLVGPAGETLQLLLQLLLLQLLLLQLLLQLLVLVLLMQLLLLLQMVRGQKAIAAGALTGKGGDLQGEASRRRGEGGEMGWLLLLLRERGGVGHGSQQLGWRVHGGGLSHLQKIGKLKLETTVL